MIDKRSIWEIAGNDQIQIAIKPLSKNIKVNGWINHPCNDLYSISLRFQKRSALKLSFLARFPTSPKKLLICFHGLMPSLYPHFYDFDNTTLTEYILLFPQDPMQTCWLGGYGGPSTWDYPVLISYLCKHLCDLYKLEKSIFMGTSMGGYGALLNSFFASPDEVYMCSPITSLNPMLEFNRTGIVENVITSMGLKRFYYQEWSYPYLDVANAFESIGQQVLIAKHKFRIKVAPYYHLLSCRYESESDKRGTGLEDFCMPFLNGAIKNGVNLFANILPIAGHDAMFFPKDIASFSDKNMSKIEKDGNPINYSRKGLVAANLFLNAIRLYY